MTAQADTYPLSYHMCDACWTVQCILAQGQLGRVATGQRHGRHTASSNQDGGNGAEPDCGIQHGPPTWRALEPQTTLRMVRTELPVLQGHESRGRHGMLRVMP